MNSLGKIMKLNSEAQARVDAAETSDKYDALRTVVSKLARRARVAASNGLYSKAYAFADAHELLALALIEDRREARNLHAGLIADIVEEEPAH